MSAVDPAAEVLGAELALVGELGELLDDGGDLASRELTWGDAGRWLLPAAEQYAAAQAAPHTARTYRSTIRSFALFVQRELGLAPSVDALVLSTVLDYKRHLQAIDPDIGRPRAKGATIAKQLSALRGFARWLTLDEDLGIDVDPRIQLVKTSRGDPPLPRALSPSELRRVLAMPDRSTTRGKRDLALLELLAHAGLRRAEAAALRWEHVIRVDTGALNALLPVRALIPR